MRKRCKGLPGNSYGNARRGVELLSRLQELAILGANDTNTTADSNAIDAEAEAIADELHRLLQPPLIRVRMFS